MKKSKLRLLIRETIKESVNEGSANINGILFDDSFFEADHEWMVQNKIELAQIINNAIASSNIKKHANENTKTITISLT
jgi:hypothetical protein